MKAIVMAGGFGTRIQPLTTSLPKPMLPILNKPMMEYIVTKLRDVGITEIIILLYYKPDVIKSYFGKGEKFGVNIKYILPDSDYGTAGAVKKAEKLVGNDDFIVISGDLVTDFALNEITGFHKLNDAFGTICLTQVEDPLQFGVVITDKNAKILRFLEKPGWGEVFSDTINTGIYVFKSEVFKYIPEDKPFDFSKDLFPALMSRNIDLYGFTAKGYWRDVGNPVSYREVFQDIFSGALNLNIGQVVHDLNHAKVYCLEDCSFDESSVSGIVFMGKNVKIDPKGIVKNSSIGSNVTIGKNCVIENSVIWDNVVINDGSVINNCVICNDVMLGRNVNILRGGIIAEHTEVGDNVTFEKDIMVWPNKHIESGSILSSNLIWGDKWKKSIFEGGKVSARTNVELSPEMAAKLGAAVGSALSKNSYVILSRDYHSASRMIKRSFLGGILSTGVNTYDLKLATPSMAKWYMKNLNASMCIYFRQSHISSTDTEITFSDGDGMPIDSNMEKNIERIFFRENFRRATHEDIGKLIDLPPKSDEYIANIYNNLDLDCIKRGNFKIVMDLFNGTGSTIIPSIMTGADIETVVLNAYFDEKKLSRSFQGIHDSMSQVSQIIKTLKADLGFIIYQNGERLQIFADNGLALSHDRAVMVILKLLSMSTEKRLKVYLPIMMPTVLDNEFENIDIVRGKSSGLKYDFLKEFNFIGWDKLFMSFPKYAICPDAAFNALKLLELLAKTGKSLSEIEKDIPEYHYAHNIISCPLSKKGYIMRKMSEDAMDKDASYIDGVKIKFRDSWVLMIPDQFAADVHLYVEAKSEERKEELLKEYIEKINTWLMEE
ncbi:NTP transferase domain-containing protein [Deferribacterales bacterium Es71-Z0220]|uniref:sugar phosphate nucleotidyltransferase n=1 Tax=Deferrivibrio essentukiensis TaxID=2880922 RepID=UPI001F621FE3|nr:sugar phosphate nucleotidyltransferase [Deferrivibrio essentukiensis]MCB4203357.1 NTP transferase domain-containing protein [Deferrivibrio essentukiensis]